VIEVALNIRKAQYIDADVVRMVKDIIDFGVIPSVAFDKITSSPDAMNAIANSPTVMEHITSSADTMKMFWNVDSARQMFWSSPIARLAIWEHIDVLRSITVTSGPNLVSETQLNTDKDASYLTYVSKVTDTADWTAVNIDDANKYIVFIHFYSHSIDDWYQGKIASYDQTTDLQVTNGGYNLTRGNLNRTSNGLWVWFKNNSSYTDSSSYARVWYIKV
jgi:hypothetical protein